MSAARGISGLVVSGGAPLSSERCFPPTSGGMDVAELSSEGRAKVKTKDFAIPSKAKTASAKKESGNYPIQDAAHARAALSRVSQHGTAAEKKQVRAKVAKKYPGIEQSKGKKK